MPRGWRKIVRGPALLALALFSGCSGCGGCAGSGDAYPANVAFPPRTDWVVIDLPKDAPQGENPPGELEDAIRKANEHGGKVLDPLTVPASLREDLDRFIGASFGTPARPAIAGDEETTALAAGLGLTDENLAAGARLFRDRCQECHGLTGDGRGPAAPWLTPHPRDYRAAVFKFTSTLTRPTRHDLFRTLSNGLKPSGMPAFNLRTEDERHRLIDYVIFLSIRGKTELSVLKTILVQGEDGLIGDVANEATAVLKTELRAWAGADRQQVAPLESKCADDSPELAAAIGRGHALFVDPKGGGCVTCHADYGREAKIQYDAWGTRIKPAPLTEPRKKGGDDPRQLFRRIRCGIPGANMPALSFATGTTDAQVWDLVFFLKALPYPDRLPADVRAKVYGGK